MSEIGREREIGRGREKERATEERATDRGGGGNGDSHRTGDNTDSADDALRAVLRTSYYVY